MRLIDADKLLDLIYEEIPANRTDDYVMGLVKAEEIVLNMYFDNSVKAIPIDWIKSKIDVILDSYPDGNEETEILCKLLYEWEKENEQSSISD